MRTRVVVTRGMQSTELVEQSIVATGGINHWDDGYQHIGPSERWSLTHYLNLSIRCCLF